MTMRSLLCTLFLLPAIVHAQVFEEIASDFGMDFQPVANSAMGGGIAWFDMNGDGWDDVYMTGATLHDRVFLNNGDGTFTDISGSAGIDITEDYNTTGVTTADIDRDGHTDVFVTTWRVIADFLFAPNLLFHNNGDGTFTEIAAEIGIADSVFSMSGTFTDINQDGWIDLYVGNYVEEAGFLFDDLGQIIGFDHICFEDQFYLNDGDGSFTNATLLYGMDNPGCTLAVRNSDVDLDNDQDLIIGNDFGQWVVPNKLFRNDYPEASMAEIGSPSNAAAQMYAMGVATGDYDHDGDLDHYLTNLGRNLLMEKQETLFYHDKSTEADVENEGWGDLLSTSWATGFADFDNDGWEDLFVVNGHVPAIDVVENQLFDPNKLYHNNGDGTFEDISEASGTADTGMGRGGAMSDYDQDGDLDFIVMNIFNAAAVEPEAVRFFQNQNASGNWVQVTLEGVESNLEGIGSLIEVQAGGESYLREISGGGDTHASQHSRRVHVGLGTVDEIDKIKVFWPNGIIDILTGPDINTSHHLVEGFSDNVPEWDQVAFELYPNPAGESCTVTCPQAVGETLVLRDVTGRWVASFVLHTETFKLDLSPFPSGTYTLSVPGIPKVQAQRLVVSHR